MRHARRNQRLSRPSEHRKALLGTLVKELVTHEKIRTTPARAKEAQRLADRLVTLGKDGGLSARRRVFQILQDRTLTKRVFTEIAPRFLDVQGGYTRVLRLLPRQGDGAEQAVLSFSRLPVDEPTPQVVKTPPAAPPTSQRTPPERPRIEAPTPSKGLFTGLRDLWTRKKKKGSSAP